jgi:putative protease
MIARLYLTAHTDLSRLDPTQVEFILALKPFSRHPSEPGESRLKEAHDLGFKLHLEWDALMEEPRFLSMTQNWSAPYVSSVRVKDAGAALWLRDHTNLDIWLHLEAGHHNRVAVESWKQRLGSRLTGVILSNELPQKTIQSWCDSLNLQTELLALGPLLLFHSPRKLLSPLKKEELHEELQATGASVESPHKGFPLLENEHGTFMFHPKDLCLIDRFEELKASRLNYYRIDDRQENSIVQSLVQDFIRSPRSAEALKHEWSKDWMRGYWNINKSDVLFDKLTNPHLQKTPDIIAEVIDGKKSHWLAVKVLGPQLLQGQDIEVVSPLGKVKSARLVWMKNSKFQDCERIESQEIGFIPWVTGTPTKSVIRCAPARLSCADALSESAAES